VDFASDAPNQFRVRASGGTQIFGSRSDNVQGARQLLVTDKDTGASSGLALGFQHYPNNSWSGVIQALGGGNANTLQLNPSGGTVVVGSGGLLVPEKVSAGYVIANALQSSKLDVAGQVTADSFKIKSTPTLVLFDISRFPFIKFNTTTTPITGVIQTVGSGVVVRQGSPPSDWWKSTNNWGLVFYTCTFTVPAGEVWDIVYTCNAIWVTDDAGGIVWTLNDDLTDDSPSAALLGRTQGVTFFGQSFTLSGPGTYTVRVKGGLYGGSGWDAIYFPAATPGGGSVANPAHCVVRKYKSN
jgi:hypothetical protein